MKFNVPFMLSGGTDRKNSFSLSVNALLEKKLSVSVTPWK